MNARSGFNCAHGLPINAVCIGCGDEPPNPTPVDPRCVHGQLLNGPCFRCGFDGNDQPIRHDADPLRDRRSRITFAPAWLPTADEIDARFESQELHG